MLEAFCYEWMLSFGDFEGWGVSFRRNLAEFPYSISLIEGWVYTALWQEKTHHLLIWGLRVRTRMRCSKHKLYLNLRTISPHDHHIKGAIIRYVYQI